MRRKGGWYAGIETVSNFRMSFRDWRPAKQSIPFPVVALHGSLSQSGMWNDLAEDAGTIRMICPDQRGYGRTQDPGAGDAAADFAKDVVCLADALLLDRFIVMGHSFAGAIALAVAAKRPERVVATVLMDPTVGGGPNAGVVPAVNDRPVEFESIAQAQKIFTQNEEGYWPPARTKRFLRNVLLCDSSEGFCRVPYQKDRLLRLREFQATSASDYDPVFWAERTKCPALVFRGGRSRRFDAESEKLLTKALPAQSRMVVCTKSGHFPNVSEPTVVQRELKEFLAELR